MNRFANLVADIDATTHADTKIAALAAYLRTAPEADRPWAMALLSGRRPKRIASLTEVCAWAAAVTGLPAWLLDAAQAVVGDRAEMIALSLPPVTITDDCTLSSRMTSLSALTGKPAETRRAYVVDAWMRLGPGERYAFNRLVTGGFRSGVDRGVMALALSQASGLPEATCAHRLMQDWSPGITTWGDLTAPGTVIATLPYPMARALVLESHPETLGDPQDWLAEWLWDGMSVQLARHGEGLALWSRAGELITDRFPEAATLTAALPQGTVIDATIVAGSGIGPLPHDALQTRIGRKSLSKRLLAKAPAHFLACDLCQADGHDLCRQPFADRRARLEAMIAKLPLGLPLSISTPIPFETWPDLAAARAQARSVMAVGVTLKHRSDGYLTADGTGRFWAWKAPPHRINAVLVYAEFGTGRPDVLGELTFALRDGGALVPVARTSGGLTDTDCREIAQWVRHQTLERFGPVRRVPPNLVFELTFEAMQSSPRRKAGFALGHPQITRWHRDMHADGIGTLDDLRALQGI